MVYTRNNPDTRSRAFQGDRAHCGSPTLSLLAALVQRLLLLLPEISGWTTRLPLSLLCWRHQSVPKDSFDLAHRGCIRTSSFQGMAMSSMLTTFANDKTVISKPFVPTNVASSRLRNLHPALAFPCVRSSRGACRPSNICSEIRSRLPWQNTASSSPLLNGEHASSLFPQTPFFPKRSPRKLVPPKASKDVPSSFRYPAMTKKPRWWWRALTCLPYLMPLHETWIYAETVYHLHPFLEDFEFFTYPFFGAIGRLPSWFLMAYFFAAYLGIVRRKEWPHFFRFHVVMGMLLEIALQVVGMVSRWMPLAFYWGKIGMHFWTAVAFGYLFTVLECIKSALCGTYADIPFVCDAAYIQIPYD